MSNVETRLTHIVKGFRPSPVRDLVDGKLRNANLGSQQLVSVHLVSSLVFAAHCQNRDLTGFDRKTFQCGKCREKPEERANDAGGAQQRRERANECPVGSFV